MFAKILLNVNAIGMRLVLTFLGFGESNDFLSIVVVVWIVEQEIDHDNFVLQMLFLALWDAS